MLTLTQQIERARADRKLTVAELLRRSGLDIDRSTLHRKLKGETPVTADECQALAACLGLTLVWMDDSSANSLEVA